MAKNLFVYSYETITTFLISNQIDGKKEKQAFVFSLSKGQLFHSTGIMANTKNFTKTLQIPSTSLLISWAASEQKWTFILKFARGCKLMLSCLHTQKEWNMLAVILQFCDKLLEDTTSNKTWSFPTRERRKIVLY